MHDVQRFQDLYCLLQDEGTGKKHLAAALLEPYTSWMQPCYEYSTLV